jgi:hypothetical protein
LQRVASDPENGSSDIDSPLEKCASRARVPVCMECVLIIISVETFVELSIVIMLQGGCQENCISIPCRGKRLTLTCNIPIGVALVMSIHIFNHNQEIILFSRTYRPVLGPTYLPVQWLLGEMHMKCEFDIHVTVHRDKFV